MDILAVVKEYGVTAGLLIAAFWYILFRCVPLHVYTDMCTREAQLADAVTQLTERVGILIDRGAR
jgi:hypothetical protein